MSLKSPAAHHLPGSTTATDWRPRSATLRVRTFSYLILLDTLCLALGFIAAAAIRGTVFADTAWLVVLAALTPLYLAFAINSRAFSSTVLSDPLLAVARSFRALLIALAMLTLVAFYLKAGAYYPRLTVGIGSGIAMALLAIGRSTFVRRLPRIVGGDPFAVALIWEAGQPIPEANFSLTIAADSFLDPERDDPMMYDRLAKALAGMHNVVVSCAPERRLAWTHALKGANIQSEILVPELQGLAPLGANVHGADTSIVVAHGPLSLVDRGVKRVFDLCVAGAAVVLLSPLMGIVALLVRLESRGPVFFRQPRIGRGNSVFQVMKFRSMRVEKADAHGERSTSRDDDRITRVGRFIRRTSIDELPQLFNVLKGEMSIVGPRPHALGSRAADKLFWEVDARYWHRHAAKPGLTGLAQVRGYRGATIREDDLRNRLQADLEYLDTWSIWRDLKIIVQTFQVLVHRNAF